MRARRPMKVVLLARLRMPKFQFGQCVSSTTTAGTDGAERRRGRRDRRARARGDSPAWAGAGGCASRWCGGAPGVGFQFHGTPQTILEQAAPTVRPASAFDIAFAPDA
jgi:hypothetical protein